MNPHLTEHPPVGDIDALLQDTWLQVISLRQGVTCAEGEGQAFWQRCVADIERVHQALKDAGHSEQSCQHIRYAQCALLDETVKGRGVQDDAYFVWCHSPLQAHFFNTLDAGS
ncbi:DotU family type IV/VI secretion system protein, partial [Yersinia pestis]